MLAIVYTVYVIGIIISYSMMRRSYGQCRKTLLIKMVWTILCLLSWLTLIGFMIDKYMSRYNDRQYGRME